MSDDELEPYVRRRNAQAAERRRLAGLSEEEERQLRLGINSRERRRMHDLNDALEDLRSTLPYSSGRGAGGEGSDTSSNGDSVQSRRMSKISTLILAANWIRHLTKANDSLRAELDRVKGGGSMPLLAQPLHSSNIPISAPQAKPEKRQIGS